jgi:predicted esterase
MSDSDLGFVHKFVPGGEGTDLMLLLLHGTGGTENDLLPLGQTLSYKAALLSPRGKVLENGMTRYFRRIAFNVFDLVDLRHRASELSRFVAEARAKYSQENKKIVAVGYSNGANVALAVMTLQPELFSGVILFRSNSAALPDPIPNLTGMPVLISAGRQDDYVEPARTELLAKEMKEAGADVTLHWNEVGHGLVREEIDSAREWLRSRFGKSV